MNPDGFQRGEEGVCQGGDYLAGRLNEGNQDLNRDFPKSKIPSPKPPPVLPAITSMTE